MMEVGSTYKWKKHQKVILIYRGKTGVWHQFSLAGSKNPNAIWCEVLDEDMHFIDPHPTPQEKMMDKPEEIISDEEIERVHANANFGGMDKREVVNQGVLKCASGYYQGHTSTQIIKEHGLITDKYKLTKKGGKYLWSVFSTDISV